MKESVKGQEDKLINYAKKLWKRLLARKNENFVIF